ncbi:MAG: amidohydrolase family protein [Planctomycetota bacterium]|jgi:imidazolonepropionase-like amidohydrolase
MFKASWCAGLAIVLGIGWGAPCRAQPAPVDGIRPARLRTHAIVGATVVAAPGIRVEDASIVIRDGRIEAVGPDVAVPPEARVWSGQGRTVYAGLIDAGLVIDLEPTAEGAGAVGGFGAHWNRRVHPELEMAGRSAPDRALRKALRGLGFTAAAVYPSRGVFRGSGAVIALADADEHVLAYRTRAAMGIGFDHGDGDGYPGSLMGAIALIRQTLLDAQWHDACGRVRRGQKSGDEPPAGAAALEALAEVIGGEQPVLFDVTDEHNALRAARIADAFELEAVLLASGYEFRRLAEIAATGLPIIVPLRYPDRPSVASLPEADEITLRALMTWEQAPTNVRRLLDAGVTVALTTHRLEKRSDFPGALYRAIRHGLDEDAALAALTTTPALMLGLAGRMGTVEPGKVANLIVVEGSLFAREPKIRDTWVNGRRHEVAPDPEIKFAGRGTLRTDAGLAAPVDLDTGKAKLTLHLPDGAKTKARKVVFQHDRLSFVLDGRLFEVEGYVRLSGTLTEGVVDGVGVLPSGGRFAFAITPGVDADAAAPEAQPPDDRAGDVDDDDEKADREEALDPPPERLVYPLGAFGLAEPPPRRDVLVSNATIWTCGPAGIIDEAVMLVRAGKIAFVGRADGLEPPPGVTVIDGAGKHVTPGLVDCHSHIGVSGGINEGTQGVTSEVRIGDVIDPDDIGWYRALAGGLTAANQLHGSANPIGGQNSVVKLKWSGSADDFRVDDAAAGIKFALGENVKRSQGRYPSTRMGVEAIIRDALTAAREYRTEWDRYRALPPADRSRTMPPRRDLELDALVEVLDGRRLVHCHSYRQDEILMLIRLAEELGFTVGTFQHVLEGYKVAEAIAAHGAGASSFSDWWAYKVEVMDAIPYSGALMHQVGVVVSFNSDSSELARRLNTEAAKAVRYGGVDPAEALTFVTINPARQLRIDHRTGSLEPGKDADFAVWSESPLSTYARCEQTWIEGARYFDLENDLELRRRAEAERARLTQKILEDAHGKPEPSPKAAPETGSEPEPEPPPDGNGRPPRRGWSPDP